MDRAFGSLWDALGFGPLREFQCAVQEFTAAVLEEEGAQARYAFVAAGAWSDAAQRICSDAAVRFCSGALRRDSDPAGPSPTPMALLRQWVQALDAAGHAVLQSEPGLQATAATVRASSRRRLAQQRLADVCGEAAGLPTRLELDEAFREIQALKRELRSLRRSAGQPTEGGGHG